MRRSGFIVLAASAMAASCGRQVTPDRPGTNGTGLSSGFMSFKFDVNGPFNFQNYSYAVVFNTSGSADTPEAAATQNGYAGYYLAIVVGSVGGGVQATAYQFVRPNNVPNATPIAQMLVVTPQQVQFLPNSNGLNPEFTVIFDRNISSLVTIGGSATPSPTPTPTPTATPTPGSSASPSASPSTAPNSGNGIWHFNYFVVQPVQNGAGLTIINSLGQGGATDATYISPALDTSTAFSQQFYSQANPAQQTDPAAQIFGGTIANNP